VADIVGNEIGAYALATFYPEHLPADLDPAEAWDRFRLEVDRLLAEGKVEEAEAYMEKRRQRFVQHGYGLRVLNQAYFAFHGSYATGPASSDPIGPKLQELKEVIPDLAHFLQTVRGFTSLTEIEEKLQSCKGQNC